MTDKYCPSCGSEVEEGDVFCSECGADINAVVGTKTNTKEENKDNGSTSGSGLNIWKAGGYMFGVLVILFALAAFSEFAILSGTLFLITAALSVPDSREWILKSSKMDISQNVIVAIIIVGMIAGMATLPSDLGDENTAAPSDAQDDSVPDTTTEGNETTPPTDEKESVNTGTQTQNEPSGPVIEGEPRKVHQLDESFQVGDIEYTVLGVRTKSKIGSGFTASEADGVYVIVDMRMTNIGNEPTRISRSPITLIDGQDRTHDTSSDGMFTYEDTIGILGEEANPGITHEGAVIFDVPTGQQERYLKVSRDPLFGEEESVYVELET